MNVIAEMVYVFRTDSREHGEGDVLKIVFMCFDLVEQHRRFAKWVEFLRNKYSKAIL